MSDAAAWWWPSRVAAAGHVNQRTTRRPACGVHAELPARICRRIDQSSEGGCWQWTGAFYPTGYGAVWLAGRMAYAHRAVYELLVGPISKGLALDHLCRNRACVNPAHLEPVTHRENVLRGIGAGAMNARKTHCKHGHAFDAANTRLRSRSGRIERICRACERRDETEPGWRTAGNKQRRASYR